MLTLPAAQGSAAEAVVAETAIPTVSAAAPAATLKENITRSPQLVYDLTS